MSLYMHGQRVRVVEHQLPQAVLEGFAEKVAQDLHQRTGKPCGSHVRVEPAAGGPIVTFTFKVGDAPLAHNRVPIADLRRAAAQGWGGLHDGMVKHVLEAGDHPAASAPIVDRSGKRHHRLIAEPGTFHRIKRS